MDSTLSEKRVLVTGASGFIGFQLVSTLVARGQQVTCFGRRPTGDSRDEQVERWRLAEFEKMGVATVYGDMTQPESFRGAVEGRSVVYHLAGCHRALHKATFYAVNATGTRNLAQCCAEQPRPPVLVFVSSMAAVGPSTNGLPRGETDPPAPVSEYGRSKRAGELAAQEFADRVPITEVRPSIVLGEGDRQTYPVFRSVARFGLHAVPTWRPHHYSVIHAADLATMLILAAERGKRLAPAGCNGDSCAQGFYFAASDVNPTYAELGRMIGEALGRRRTRIVRFGPMWLFLLSSAGELRARILRRQGFANYDKAREIRAGGWMCSARAAAEQLGFAVAAPLSERLRQTAQWYRAHGWI